jgi:hypothetical protein
MTRDLGAIYRHRLSSPLYKAPRDAPSMNFRRFRFTWVVGTGEDVDGQEGSVWA